MKFKVGDKVKVVNQESDALNWVGQIIEVDEDWMYPYDIDFGSIKFEQELFCDEDLEMATNQDEVLYNVKDVRNKIDDVNIVIDSQPSFINIKFQEGAIKNSGVNGAKIEDVIEVLIKRLQEFQNGKFPCKENACAITHLQEAQNWLYRRTMKRREQGVEGEDKKHE